MECINPLEDDAFSFACQTFHPGDGSSLAWCGTRRHSKNAPQARTTAAQMWERGGEELRGSGSVVEARLTHLVNKRAEGMAST